VAAVGRLFGPNPERGVFMTTDGGKTWQHTLKINQDVGANDITIDPSNPNHLLASTYERPPCFVGLCGRRLRLGHPRVDGRRQDVEAHQRSENRERPSEGIDGPRVVRLVQEHAERDLRADRSGRRQGTA
jgi:hypothetical protein